MVRLPVLDRLYVNNYGLYPGLGGEDSPLYVDLGKPLTLILGANGIGKTSLVSLLFRMLCGPFELGGSRGRGLGRGNLSVRDLTRAERRYFAVRVNDGARAATATLHFDLGQVHFLVTRNLADLSLVDAGWSNQVNQLGDPEESLKDAITAASELGDYSDWLLLLRYVTFFQEDRQSLIWDVEAQTEILRPLFLSAADSNTWVDLERSVLQADSRRRNLSAVIYQTSEYLRRQDRRASSAPDLTSHIAEWEAELDRSSQESDSQINALATADEARKSARLSYLIAEEAVQESRANYERAKMAHVLEGLPDASATAQYILAQLISAGYCAGCGRDSDELETTFEERLANSKCVVCGRIYEAVDADSLKLEEVTSSLLSKLERVDAEQEQVKATEVAYSKAIDASRRFRQEQADLREKIESARAQLPDDERETTAKRDQVALLKEQLSALDANLAVARDAFSDFLKVKTFEILERAREIEVAFNRYASAFLLESNHLTWSEQGQKVGQMGGALPFPNFALELRGTNFTNATARASADSVSESQREFIDLAFRMALLDLASAGGATVVIDAPDGSLDAVFEPKAADVLGEYATSGFGKNLILTSNISSGEFLPKLIRQTREIAGREPTIVDLFEVGVPTAAVTALADEYSAARANLRERAGIA